MNVTLLRKYIAEVVAQVQNYRVPNQLVSKPGSRHEKKAEDADKEEEVDEVNVAANIAGFMAPLGFSSEDMKGPGAGKRAKKKPSARWK